MGRPVPSKHLAYHRLLEQLARDGCALCELGSQAAARALERLSGEQLLDPDARGRLRTSLGFCARHAHQLEATAPRLSLAILYDDFLERVEGEMETWAHPRRRRAGPPFACPACAAAEEEEREHLRVLAEFIEEPEMAAAREASAGLCLPHTLALCRLLPEPARRRMVAQERARIARLRADLAEVIRKHDYRFRDEPWGEERTAPERAVAKVVGAG